MPRTSQGGPAGTGRLLKSLAELSLTVEGLKLIRPAATVQRGLPLALHNSSDEILSGVTATGKARAAGDVDGLSEGHQFGSGQRTRERAWPAGIRSTTATPTTAAARAATAGPAAARATTTDAAAANASTANAAAGLSASRLPSLSKLRNSGRGNREHQPAGDEHGATVGNRWME
jgi:hypothetical protein